MARSRKSKRWNEGNPKYLIYKILSNYGKKEDIALKNCYLLLLLF